MANIKKIEQIDMNTGVIIKVWDSAIQAEQEAGFNSRRISQVCKGKSSQSGSYNWRYLNKTKEYGTQGPVEFKGVTGSGKKTCVLVSLDLKILATYSSKEEAAIINKRKNVKNMIIKNQKFLFKNLDGCLLFELDFFNNNKQKIKGLLDNSNQNELSCKICHNVYSTMRELATHIQMTHELETKQYAIDYLYNGSAPTCKLCGLEPRYVSLSFKEYCKTHAKEAMKKGGMKGGVAEAWNRGKTKENDERILRQANEMKGENNHFYGKRHAEETKTHISSVKKLGKETVTERLNRRSKEFIFPEFNYASYGSRQEKIKCVCVVCNTEQEKSLTQLERGSLCRKCFPFMMSKDEIEVGNYIENDLGIQIARNDRKLIAPKELDIFIEHQNLAIEYNGLYWHSEAGCEAFDKNAHQLKTDACKEHGIKLFQIFSDEWFNKNELVKSMIRYKLGLAKYKIGARECKVEKATSHIAKPFFEESHISGHTNASAYFALTYDEEVVAMVSLRIPIQKKYPNVLELARFATKPDWCVMGGFSKLLKAMKKYVKESGYDGILSYADLRTGTGNVYAQSGFEKVGETKPSYWYTNGDIRYDRFKFRAQLGKPEKQIAEENGVSKIYGCKNAIYVLKV